MPHAQFLYIQYMHMHVYKNNEIVVLTLSDIKAWIVPSYESRWNRHNETVNCMTLHAHFLNIQYLYTHLYMHMHVYRKSEIVVLTFSDTKAWIVPSQESRWNRYNWTVNCMTLHAHFLYIQYLYTHLYMHMHVYRKTEIVVLTFNDTKAWIVLSYESRWNRQNWTVNCMALHAHFLNIQYLYTHVHRKNEIVGLTLYPNDNLWFSLSNDWTGDDIRY